MRPFLQVNLESWFIHRSKRKCLAKGIIRGLSHHDSEAIELQETSCMLQAASSCEIQVRLRKPGVPVRRPVF